MAVSLLIAILTEESSDKALDIAELQGVRGATLLSAEGISRTPFTTFFGLTYQAPMKLVFWIADAEKANRLAQSLHDELKLDSPSQGMAFTMPIDKLHGLTAP
jgi:uncharacterized protein YaaQ